MAGNKEIKILYWSRIYVNSDISGFGILRLMGIISSTTNLLDFKKC